VEHTDAELRDFTEPSPDEEDEVHPPVLKMVTFSMQGQMKLTQRRLSACFFMVRRARRKHDINNWIQPLASCLYL
jgi:hypothetical protein